MDPYKQENTRRDVAARTVDVWEDLGRVHIKALTGYTSQSLTSQEAELVAVKLRLCAELAREPRCGGPTTFRTECRRERGHAGECV